LQSSRSWYDDLGSSFEPCYTSEAIYSKGFAVRSEFSFGNKCENRDPNLSKDCIYHFVRILVKCKNLGRIDIYLRRSERWSLLFNHFLDCVENEEITELLEKLPIFEDLNIVCFKKQSLHISKAQTSWWKILIRQNGFLLFLVFFIWKKSDGKCSDPFLDFVREI